MPDANHSESTEAPVLTTTEARQGRRGKHALWVLVISMGLIVVIYAVMVVGVQGPRLSSPGGQGSVDRKTANTYQSSPSPPREAETPAAAAQGQR